MTVADGIIVWTELTRIQHEIIKFDDFKMCHLTGCW